MRLEIRCQGAELPEGLRSYLAERLCAALRPLERYVGSVQAYLRGGSGPRREVTSCRVVTELPPRGRVVVTGIGSEVRAAITGAARRLGATVRRHINRRRSRLRGAFRAA
jgi:ribosome-associated translation inhibitor RaiA